MKPGEKIKRLEAYLDQLDATLTPEEFVQAFSLVIGILEKEQTGNADAWKAIHAEFAATKKRLAADSTVVIGKALKALTDRMDATLRDQDRGMNFLRDKVRGLKDGKTPKKGVDYFDGAPGQPGEDAILTPEEIRDRLETLADEDRLDASAIKNLPERVIESQRVIAGATALWHLMDVDVAGIVAGQSIRWDGIRWTPFSPSTANTAVFGEVPSDSGDHLSFTLAHTPVAGTVRLYRGGAYQQSGPGNDYTISGATITLAAALQSAEILLTDYEY